MNMVFEFIKDFFAVPFGYILSFFYNTTESYLFAIVLLTILIKLCFLPTSIMQQKSLLAKTKYNQKLGFIKKHCNDKPDELKKRTAALKASDNSKKLNSGCLPSIVQIVVLIGLFGVMYSPLSSVLNVDKTAIDKMTTVMSETVNVENTNMIEIELLKNTNSYKEELLSEGVLEAEKLDEIIAFNDKYTFLGLSLSEKPEFTRPNALWMIPLLVLTIGIISPLYSFVRRKLRTPGKWKFAAIEALPFILPMISFLFAFMFPIGLGLYWAFSNLLSFIQSVVLNLIYNPQKITLSEEEKNELLSDIAENAEMPSKEIYKAHSVEV